jgi:hypothetical protein
MTRPPSMDEKHIPSPPTRTVEEYEADKAAGIFRGGKPYDRTSWELHRKACEAAGLNPDDAPLHYHERTNPARKKEDDKDGLQQGT